MMYNVRRSTQTIQQLGHHMNNSLPLQSTVHDAHTLSLQEGTYDVYKLIRFTAHMTPVMMKTLELESQLLAEECWSDSEKKTFSPSDLLKAYRNMRSWEKVLE